MSLGNNILILQKKAGLTQEALAKKLCVTNQAVSKWETDQCCPDTMLLPDLADALDCTIDSLFGRELIITWESETEFSLMQVVKKDDFRPFPGTKDGKFSYDDLASDTKVKSILELASKLSEDSFNEIVTEVCKPE